MKMVKHFLTRIPRNKKLYFLGSILLILIIVRLITPLFVKKYLNDYLAHSIENYSGHVEDFNLSLWRGACQIEKYNLKKTSSKKNNPFIEVERIDISILWGALFRGKLLFDMNVAGPKINFVDSKRKENKQLGKDFNWKDLLTIPFNVESLRVTKGEIHFYNNETKDPINIFLKNIEVRANNIYNLMKKDVNLFSDYEVAAIAQNHAKLYSKGNFNVLVEPPAFYVLITFEKLKLTQINNFLKVYGPIDVTRGEFYLYVELTSKQGKLYGYLKPIIKNMKVRAGGKGRDDSFENYGFGAAITMLNDTLKNRDTAVVSAIIPLTGNLNDLQMDFGKGLSSAIDNSSGKRHVKPGIDKKIHIEKPD